MPTFSYHDGTAVRVAKALAYHDGTAVRTIKEAWYHDGTAARKVFTSFTPVNAAVNSLITGSSYAPQVRFQSDGSTLVRTFSGALAAGASWGTPTTSGAGAGYWIKVELSAGSASVSGDAISSWLQLNVERVWGIAAAPFGSVSERALTFQIATDAAGATVVASGTIDLSSDRS